MTPDLHRIHHSAWKPETNCNFGAVLPVWDLVFGTFRATPRDGHERMRLGLDDVRGRDAQRPFWLLGSIIRDRLTGGDDGRTDEIEAGGAARPGAAPAHAEGGRR